MRNRELIVLLILVTASLVAWGAMQLYIANERAETEKITVDRLFTEPEQTPVMDDATIQVFRNMDAVQGGWWSGDGGLHWDTKHCDRLVGFQFSSFPKDKLPLVGVPFGLYLKDADLKNSDLRTLGHLKNLTLLELAPSQITDRHLRALREIGMLHVLSVTQGDHYWPRPKSANDVRRVFLGGSPITDAGVRELRDFKNVSELHLDGTNITDTALRELKNFDRLRIISLARTKVTDTGLKSLRNELPGLIIDP